MKQYNDSKLERDVPPQASEIMSNEHKLEEKKDALVLLYADEFVCVTAFSVANNVTNNTHSTIECSNLDESLKTPNVPKNIFLANDTSPFQTPPSLVESTPVDKPPLSISSSLTKSEEEAEERSAINLPRGRVLDQYLSIGDGHVCTYSNDSVSSMISGCGSDSSSTDIISEKSITASEADIVSLRRKWIKRDKTLKRLSRGKSTRHSRFLKENENEARKIALMRLEVRRNHKAIEQGIRSDTKSTLTNDTIKPETSKPDWQSMEPTKSGYNSTCSYLCRLFNFETYHSLPCFITVLLYCVMHVSIYELVSTIISELSANSEYQSTVYLLVLLFGLGLMRASGVLWHWIHDDEHPVVKFDMQNRVRLNEPDALIVLWFRRHKWTRNVVHIVSHYLCFCGVSYFLILIMKQWSEF